MHGNFIDFIEIVGKDQVDHDCMNESWEISKVNAYRKFKRNFDLMRGDRSYFNSHLKRWIPAGTEGSPSSTVNVGEEHLSKWNKPPIDHVNMPQASNVMDMYDIAENTTRTLQRMKWKLPKLIRNLRQEQLQLPNPYIRPDLYQQELTGYPELETIMKIARDGVEVKMNNAFRAPRPWEPNFVRKESQDLVINEFLKLFNAGRGILLNAKEIKDEIKSVVVSPVGAVPKGNKPMSEALRVIGGLSTPGERSINRNTETTIPDAKFGKIQEIADRILELKWTHPKGTEIMALNADIDSAFYQIPVSADSVGLFALVIPGTSIMYIPYALTFGWKGSPGFFAVFVKGVRWHQRFGGSYIGHVWIPFHCFIWVDDIIIIEPD